MTAVPSAAHASRTAWKQIGPHSARYAGDVNIVDPNEISVFTELPLTMAAMWDGPDVNDAD